MTIDIIRPELECETPGSRRSADGALYAGIDPWGNPLTVTLTSEETLSGIWNQSFNSVLFTQTFDNAQDGFSMEGPLDDSDCITCRYTGAMILDGEVMTVIFSDGGGELRRHDEQRSGDLPGQR